MTLDRLLFAEQAGTVFTAEDYRSILAAFAAAERGEMYGSFPGTSLGFVVGPNDLACTPGGAVGLSVTVSGGWALVCEDSSAQRSHLVHENASTVISTGWSAADPSLDRVDLVCVHVRDNELDASGHNDSVYFIKTGTPGAGVPSDPGAQYIVLYEATVPAGATAGTSIVLKDRRVPLRKPTPHVRLFDSTPVAAASGTMTTNPSWDTEVSDTDNMHRPGTNPSRITIQTAGVYHVAATIRFADASLTLLVVQILLNGATVIARDDRGASVGGPGYACGTAEADRVFAVGDYLEVQYRQISGSTLTPDVISECTPIFSATRTGPAI